MKNELIAAATKAAPPVSVSLWQYLLGLPVEKWVGVATFTYIVLQATFLVYDRFKGVAKTTSKRRSK